MHFHELCFKEFMLSNWQDLAEDIHFCGFQSIWALYRPSNFYIKLLFAVTASIYSCVCTQTTMQTNPPNHSSKKKKSLKASHPKFWAVQNVWVAQVSVHRNKEEERGVLHTMWMKEIIRAVPGCFIGRRQPRILEENIAESCHCVFGEGERRERDCLNWE